MMPRTLRGRHLWHCRKVEGSMSTITNPFGVYFAVQYDVKTRIPGCSNNVRHWHSSPDRAEM
jgi:hypothetical protein